MPSCRAGVGAGSLLPGAWGSPGGALLASGRLGQQGLRGRGWTAPAPAPARQREGGPGDAPGGLSAPPLLCPLPCLSTGTGPAPTEPARPPLLPAPPPGPRYHHRPRGGRAPEPLTGPSRTPATASAAAPRGRAPPPAAPAPVPAPAPAPVPPASIPAPAKPGAGGAPGRSRPSLQRVRAGSTAEELRLAP